MTDHHPEAEAVKRVKVRRLSGEPAVTYPWRVSCLYCSGWRMWSHAAAAAISLADRHARTHRKDQPND